VSSLKPPRRTQYHHGDLRNALLMAARSLAQERGVDALSLREVAHRAGVSHAAAYHHFVDKRDLLRTLATQAFEELEAGMLCTIENCPPGADLLEEVAVGYLHFARAHPAEFRFMFHRELDDLEQPGSLEEASLSSLQALMRFVGQLQQRGQLQQIDNRLLTLTYWSLMHGMTTLILETATFGQMTAEEIDRTLRQMVGLLVGGVATQKA
jgi:AcrR family transcriptional regulator